MVAGVWVCISGAILTPRALAHGYVNARHFDFDFEGAGAAQRGGRGLSIGGESRKFPGRSAANGAPRMNAATLSYGAKNRSWRSKAFFAFGSRFSENQLATYKLRLHYIYTYEYLCTYNEAVICT